MRLLLHGGNRSVGGGGSAVALALWDGYGSFGIFEIASIFWVVEAPWL